VGLGILGGVVFLIIQGNRGAPTPRRRRYRD
jgi:hypothetical protein